MLAPMATDQPVALVSDTELESLAVVANSAMNRRRQLVGVNSYERELGFRPLDALRERLTDPHRVTGPRVAWLDVCCGAGLAAGECARGLAGADVVGLDLVDAFEPDLASVPNLELVVGSVLEWEPGRRFDVITCVHGLHYVGDKLAALTRLASWLQPDGMFVADFDPSSVRLADGRPAGRALIGSLRAAGFDVDTRRRRIRLDGGCVVELPYAYLGADPHAGPNYTGQPAVHSYYVLT